MKVIKVTREYVEIEDEKDKEHIASVIKQLEKELTKEDGTYRGLGLSAVQIGVLERISIVRIDVLRLDLVNPRIVSKSNRIKFNREGCLSLPNTRIDTARYNNITIVNNEKTEEYHGIIAVCIQHEIDHMNGMTIFGRRWRKK